MNAFKGLMPGEGNEKVKTPEAPVPCIEKQVSGTRQEATYRIRFKPNRDLFT